MSRSQKSRLQFLVGLITRFLRPKSTAKCVAAGALVYLSAILEYLAAKMEDYMVKIDNNVKEAAYHAWLGYYLGESRVFTATQLLAMMLSNLKGISEKNLIVAIVDC